MYVDGRVRALGRSVLWATALLGVCAPPALAASDVIVVVDLDVSSPTLGADVGTLLGEALADAGRVRLLASPAPDQSATGDPPCRPTARELGWRAEMGGLGEFLGRLRGIPGRPSLSAALRQASILSATAPADLVLVLSHGHDTCGGDVRSALSALATTAPVVLVRHGGQRAAPLFVAGERQPDVAVLDWGDDPASVGRAASEWARRAKRPSGAGLTVGAMAVPSMLPPIPRDRPGTRATLWALGIGGALAAAAVAVGAVAYLDYREFRTAPMTDPDYELRRARIERVAFVSDLLYAGASAAGIVAAATYWAPTGPDDDPATH